MFSGARKCPVFFEINKEEKYFVEDEQDRKKLYNGHEIGYYISSKYGNLGIVSSAVNFVCNEIAFKELHLNYINGICFEDNDKSKQVLKNGGFKCVELLQNGIEENGEKRNIYWFIKERKID